MTRMRWDRRRWERLGARLPTENTGGNPAWPTNALPKVTENAIIRQALFEEAKAEPTPEGPRYRPGRRRRRTHKIRRMEV